jgi:hypothetical protein
MRAKGKDKRNSGKFIAFVKKLLVDAGCTIIVAVDNMPLKPESYHHSARWRLLRRSKIV